VTTNRSTVSLPGFGYFLCQYYIIWQLKLSISDDSDSGNVKVAKPM